MIFIAYFNDKFDCLHFSYEQRTITFLLTFFIQDAQVATATSGNGNLVLGDNTGNVHLINRAYEITTFRAYEITLVLAQQVQHSTFLFTIGVRRLLLSLAAKYFTVKNLI